MFNKELGWCGRSIWELKSARGAQAKSADGLTVDSICVRATIGISAGFPRCGEKLYGPRVHESAAGTCSLTSEVFVISDDELPPRSGTFRLPLAPPPHSGALAEVHLTRSGSGSSSAGTTGTAETYYTHGDVRTRLSFPGTGLSF